VDRRHLEYFVSVVEHRGITSASLALHVSQPSLSQAIKGLERELGVELFRRTAQGVRLTAAGDALLGPARLALRDFDAAKTAVRNVAGLEAGRLEVLALPGLAADPLVGFVTEFLKRYPGIVVRIDNAAAEDIIEMVRVGHSELGLTYGPAATHELDVIEFPPEEALLALPPDTPDVQGCTLPITYLSDLKLIVSTGTKVRALSVLAELGVTHVNVAVETAHRDTVIPLILAGVAAAILPPALAKDARAGGAVICRLDPPPTRSLLLAYRQTALTPAAAAFLEVVDEMRPAADATTASVGAG